MCYLKQTILMTLFLGLFSAVYGTDFEHTEKITRLERVTNYHFRNSHILQDFFTHHSMPGGSKFQELAFLGDKVIGSVAALRGFNIEEKVSNLQNVFANKTNNQNFSEQSKRLGLLRFVDYNKNNNAEKIAADAFEALVGVIQLDFEGHPNQISPAAISFVVKSLELPRISSGLIAQQSAGGRELPVEDGDRERNSTLLASSALAGAFGAGIGLWSWFTGPDYKKMYENCRAQRDALALVLISILCWQYVIPYWTYDPSSQ